MRALVATLILCLVLLLSSSCGTILNKVVVISLDGAIDIDSNPSLFGGSNITPDDVKTQLQSAQDDINVRAIVIQVNSPGGDVSACQEIVYAMENVTKPIVISMRSEAASGGYYISARAAKIVALPSTLTGSIGVISEIPNLKGLFDKVGVDMQIIKSGKYKDMYSGYTELTDEERAIVQRTNDEMYEQFITQVAEGRNMDPARVRELATGQAYSGVDAKELGLVDELGGLQTAIDEAARLASIQNPSVEYYHPTSPGLLQLLFSGSHILSDPGILRPLSSEQAVAVELLQHPYPRFRYQ